MPCSRNGFTNVVIDFKFYYLMECFTSKGQQRAIQWYMGWMKMINLITFFLIMRTLCLVHPKLSDFFMEKQWCSTSSRDLFKGKQLRDIAEKKSLAHCGMRTHDILIRRLALYCCATTAA